MSNVGRKLGKKGGFCGRRKEMKEDMKWADFHERTLYRMVKLLKSK